MTTMVQDAVVWLIDKIEDYASVDITYYRGTSSVAIKAEARVRSYTIPLESGLGFTNVSVRDYRIRAAVVVISGSVVKPHQGDVIQETIGGVVYKCAVLSFGSMSACEPEDADETWWIVHTKVGIKT